jgi:hypothetical protein
MNEFMTKWQEIVKKAWKDKEFKRELRANPNAVLKKEGFPIPAGMNFVVVENEPYRMFLVLPAPPAAIKKVIPAGNETVSQYNASCI